MLAYEVLFGAAGAGVTHRRVEGVIRIGLCVSLVFRPRRAPQKDFCGGQKIRASGLNAINAIPMPRGLLY